MAGGDAVFELRREGHSYEMAAENLSTANIGLVFGVSGYSVLQKRLW